MPIGSQPFTNHRNPPPYRKLNDAEFARYDLGMTVFNTQFVVAGTPGAGRRDGVGPLFNSASCDACHNNGAHGRGPIEDGPAPTPLVVQLAMPTSDGGQALASGGTQALTSGGTQALTSGGTQALTSDGGQALPSGDALAKANDPPGDPVYGRVFNTVALEGLAPEGVVMIRYQVLSGRYPDGTPWSLHFPHYSFEKLRYGPLAQQTIVKPRLAPALFGVGLLDAAADAGDVSSTPIRTRDRNLAAANGIRGVSRTSDSRGSGSNAAGSSATDSSAAGSSAADSNAAGSRAAGSGAAGSNSTASTTTRVARHGRFGWQGSAFSVRDQTARAFAREMGLTSADVGHDDCTSAETDCLHQPNGGTPEVSDDLFDAVLSFQRWLAVPASPLPHSPGDPDAKVFADLGCAACHQPQLHVALSDASGKTTSTVIAPYTDLRLHDLGDRLADQNVAGQKVPSKWRTAPLWGLGYRMSFERFPTFLHDGRARSIEEAILWHDGEAASARDHFEKLSAKQRKALLHWVETL